MKRFVLTPSAKQDLKDIWAYIAKDNATAADRVLDALELAILRLAKNPASATGAKNWPIDGTVFFWPILISSSIVMKPSRCKSFAFCMPRVTYGASWDSTPISRGCIPWRRSGKHQPC